VGFHCAPTKKIRGFSGTKLVEIGVRRGRILKKFLRENRNLKLQE
jgi:SAM-dependent MidA family methyltransferase